MSGNNTGWVPGVKRPPPPAPTVTPQLHTWTVGLVGPLTLRNQPGNGTAPVAPATPATIVGTGPAATAWTGGRAKTAGTPQFISKPRSQAAWEKFLAAGPNAATRLEVARLEGWDGGAAVAGQGFTTEIAQLRTKAIDGGKMDEATADFGALQIRVAKCVADWTLVRRHNIEAPLLAKSFGFVNTIPDAAAKPALKPQWDAYHAAILAMPNPATSTAQADQLVQTRQNASTAAQNLRQAYEIGLGATDAPDIYYDERFSALWDAESHLVQKASCVPVLNAGMAQLMKEMQTAFAARSSGNAKQNYDNLATSTAKAKQLIALRTQADPAEAAYMLQYAKIAPLVDKALAEPPAPTDPSAPVSLFRAAHGVLRATLDGGQADRFTKASASLGDLNSKAEAVLAKAVAVVSGAAQAASAMPDGDPAAKQLKSEAARAAVEAADPTVLQNLTADDKLSLLSSLHAEPLPVSDDSTTNDPKRVALRKLYAAMTIEAKFLDADTASRKAVVDTLMRDHKQEFRDARENWTVMSPEQRAAVLQKAVDAQCAEMNYPSPAGTPGGPAAVGSMSFYADENDGDNGRYSMSKDIILINTKMPVFDDFELALDLIFHENTHNYQRVLCEKLNAGQITTDPPLTQAKFFFQSWQAATNAYVSGSEDYDGYQAQPIEAHAWLAGPQTAHMLLDALDA